MSRDKQYQALSDELRRQNDEAFGIRSYLNSNNAWVRDATQAIPLADRIPHDAPELYGNDALLRCISRLRPIDYAIHEKTKRDPGEDVALVKFQEEIYKIVDNQKLSDKQKKTEIDSLEKGFNTHLVQKLYDAGLTKGCYTGDDAANLLFHYRNLSSVLEPARTMITLTYDKTAGVLNRETQYPVTEKTKAQKQEIAKLKDIDAYPTSAGKSAHTAQRQAMQEADALFADLMGRDDRALPAQTRKSHLATAKNAFVVKSELIQIEGELPESTGLEILPVKDPKNDVLWLARMGSPVYVGKGETSDRLVLHTKENLEQVRKTAQALMDEGALKLHVTTLNTYAPHESQLAIIDNVYAATRGQLVPDDVSYVPVNTYGTLPIFPLDVAKGISKPADTGRFLQKATRAQAAVDVVLDATSKAGTLSVVHCASGQDRTGTMVELAEKKWTEAWYKKDKSLDSSNIQEARIRGGNAAEIASHLVPGSTGLKTDSLANNQFGKTRSFTPDAEKEIYRKSAKTNKAPSVGQVAFLKDVAQKNDNEYCANLEKLKTLIDKKPPQQNASLIERAREVVASVEAIKKTNSKAKTVDELNLVLGATHDALHDSNDATKTEDHAKRLAKLSEHTLGHESPKWKKLGMALAFFACAALVVVGVLAGIPTG